MFLKRKAAAVMAEINVIPMADARAARGVCGGRGDGGVPRSGEGD